MALVLPSVAMDFESTVFDNLSKSRLELGLCLSDGF
jgi:hypothetical protein